MKEIDIHQQLQALTEKLHLLVDQSKGNLQDPGVVAVSQEMDRLIVSIQRMRLGKTV